MIFRSARFPIRFLLFFFILSGTALSRDVIIDETFTREVIGAKTSYVIDSKSSFTFDDVLKRQDWKVNNDESVHLGFVPEAYWFKFSVENAREKAVPLFLEIDYPQLFDLEFFRPGPGGGFESVRTGTDFHYDTREIPDRNFIFKIDQAPGHQNYYLRVKTRSPMNFIPRIFTEKAFHETINFELSLHWIYFGFLFTIMFFAIFLFAILKRSVYLYSALFSLSLIIVAAHLNGFAYQYAWRSSIHAGQKMIFLAGSLGMLFLSQFIRMYMNTRKNFKFFDKTLDLVATVPGLILAAVSVFILLDIRYLLVFSFWLVLVMTVLCSLIIYGFVKKSRESVLMLAGFFGFFAGILIYILKEFSIIPINFMTQWSMQICSSLSVITYSLALPYRMNYIDEEFSSLNKELLKSQYYLKLAQEISHLGSWSFDVATGTRQWSSGVENILKVKEEDLPRMASENPITKYVYPDDRQKVNDIIKKSIKQEESPPFACRIITADGQVRWILSIVRYIKNENTRGILFGTAQDITDRRVLEAELEKKNAELNVMISELKSSNEALSEINEELIKTQAELMESEDRFRRFTEKAQDVLFRFSFKKMGFDFLNDAIRVVTGYDAEEFIKNPNLVRDITHPDYNGYYDARTADLNKGYFPENYNLGIVHKNGDERWVQMHNVLIRDQNGNPVALEGIARDITEQKVAENLLKSSLHEKEILLKEIHHRVKNNLQVIISLLNLQAGYVSNEQDRQLFMESQNRVLSMAMVHQKMYQSENLGRINFRDYLTDLARELSLIYSIDNDIIKIEIVMEDVFLGVDLAIPIALIVNELISNSLKHAFPGGLSGEIDIGFCQDEDMFILTVSDNGVGLPPSINLDKIESLGLELIQALASQLRGTVTIQGPPGTSVTLRFPRQT